MPVGDDAGAGGVVQHQPVVPPQGWVGGGIVAEQFGAFKQGVEHEQPAVGVPPQGLLRGVGGGELGDARAQLCFYKLE